MRDQVLAPTTKFQSRTILREKVFVKWVNQSGISSAIGACLPQNSQNSEFLMTARSDKDGHLHVDFTLMVSIKLGGKNIRMELMLVVPPDANFTNSPTLPKSNPNDLPPLDASALHDAGICDESGHVIMIPFNLTTKGFVIMKKRISTTIRPSNNTSNQLILNLKSLASTVDFSVFIRPSDGAQKGLKELCRLLDSSATTTHKPNSLAMYVQHGAMLVEWDRFVYESRQDVQSLPNPNSPTWPLPDMQVPLPQPALDVNTLLPHQNNVEFGGPPPRTPINPDLAPLVLGISSSDEESSDNGVNLEDFEKDHRCVEMNFEEGSDENLFVHLHPHELSEQLKNEMLASKLEKWLAGAQKINSNFFEHERLIPKLSILGDCVRTSNAKVFDATLPWCSAILFYDPLNSENGQLWQEQNKWLISDIAKLIRWAHKFHHGAEISSFLVDHFLKLGNVARTFAQHPEHADTEYRLQKNVCIGRVLIGFGKAGGSISGIHSRPVSRKRDALEACGNMSKRARNIM